MKALRLFVAFALAAAIDVPAPVVLAQSAATAVSACGSATYTAGQQYPLQQTTTGNQCTNATLSGSVTVGNATITAPLGTHTIAASVATTINGALPAGTNILGNIGIDQTTPGTTNGVVVNSSGLPTGAATSALQTSVGATAHTDAAAINTTLGSPIQATGGTVGIVNGANQAAVKPASTAPLATDPALVVTISPNSTSISNPVTVNIATPPNDVLTGPITCSAACAATTQVNAQGSGSVGIVATGTGSGMSFTFQASIDGSTWFSVPAYTPAAVVVAPGTAQSANGQWTVPASGWRFVRVNLASIGGGSEIFNVNSSAGSVVPPGASITVNAPPNDVLLGPATISSPADETVNSQGSGSVGLQITGTCTALSALIRATVDGTNYFNVPAFSSNTGAAVVPGTAITATGSWFIPAAGWRLVQIHPTALTASCTFTLNSSAGSIQPLVTASGAAAVDVIGVGGATLSATNPLFDAPVPTTSGGLSVKSFIVANNTTSVAVKASAGQIYGITASSISAATPVFIKTYNIAQGSNTCGSNTPVQREMIPAPGVSGGGTNIQYQDGVAFGTAISVCVTAGQADNDTTAPAATTYIVNILYK